MACQGCGKTSDNRLCCPTCIELGRTSFFCGQECFTKYWGAHNELHKLLRKKRAAEAEAAAGQASTDGNVPKAADGAGGSSSSMSTLSSERQQETSTGYRGTGMAPLAGGMPPINLGARKAPGAAKPSAAAAGAAKKSDDGAVPPPSGNGVFGSLLGHAQAMLGSQHQGAGNFASALKSRFNGPEAAELGQSRSRAGLRDRSVDRSVDRRGDPSSGKGTGKGDGAASPSRSKGTRQSSSLQTMLWIFIVVTIVGGGLFYRRYQQLSEDYPASQVSTPSDSAPAVGTDVVVIPGAPKVSGAEAKDTSRPVSADGTGSNLRAATPTATIIPVPAAATSEASETVALRVEVASLRELVDKHEKMLRYVMERYVEKDQKLSGPAPVAGVHEASVAKLSESELAAKTAAMTDADLVAAMKEKASHAGSGALRKRQGGGDSVGVPVSEQDADGGTLGE
eukprot:TRINITY_DN3460_c0_g3_i1.p1 TRINITY_DN3460_c0_g3~~TRINITY_DN3460_c0_g3_i1.p1  ORF type:complete len:452 (+),score=117.68 TRINITY_DN3460_c0_g3_i1:66-1421(+)